MSKGNRVTVGWRVALPLGCGCGFVYTTKDECSTHVKREATLHATKEAAFADRAACNEWWRAHAVVFRVTRKAGK